MRTRLNVTLVLAMALLQACSSSGSPSQFYGNWQLVELRGDSTGTHQVGETLQLLPDSVARFSGPGVEPRRVRFSTFTGTIDFPSPGQKPEGTLMVIEGETEVFIAGMPTRNTLQLTANGISPLAFTYRRAR